MQIYNNADIQKISEQLVSNHVLHVATHYVGLILRNHDNGDDTVSKWFENRYYSCMSDDLPDSDDMIDGVNDVMQWLFVTKYLYDKLVESGELCVDTPDGWIWGRKTYGQPISMDGIIKKIAAKEWQCE